MSDHWKLVYEGLDKNNEALREALCTLGNGVFCTRGAAEEQFAGAVHYPGTYVAGGYNELESEVADRRVINEDLVNFPNWLWLTFRLVDGDWLDLWEMEVLDYRQELDLRKGVLSRSFRVRDEKNRITGLTSRRLVHLEKPHLAALEWRLVPENWSGDLLIKSGLDGSVTNANVDRYRQLKSKHLEVVDSGAVAPHGIFLKSRTSNSDIEVAQAARTRCFKERKGRVLRRILMEHPERIAEEIDVKLGEGEELRVEKVVSLYTSRDPGIGECGKAARQALDGAPDFDELLESHSRAWETLWQRCDVEVGLTEEVPRPVHDQLVLRLHIFHALQTASPNTVGRDVGIPARGLHGEAYRGHIFWDEVFILPFFIQRLPSIARTAILYRYHRLDAARQIARQAGGEGACFPWQSASDGCEVTQELHLNPMSGKWDSDYSHLQRHVNSAIVYNLWKYFEATGDRPFMEEFGAEIVLEIARFWSSMATFNEASGRFEIQGVMGPDEYHEKYPDAEAGGLKNNTYTNLTAVWCLLRALDVLDLVSRQRRSELMEMLDIGEADLKRWEALTRKMTLVFHDGVLSQFEGYDELEELDWEGYAERYGDIHRLDRILKAEGTSPDRFKVSKQADVTMLLYLFTAAELQALFSRLGYPFDDADMKRNVDYYRPRTSHGSTLSKIVFTSAVHREDSEEGSRLFLAALESDLYDVQGGTTSEGIHLGAMVGTVDIVMRYYAGLELRRDGVCFSPSMPRRIESLRFRFQHQRRWYDVDLSRDRLCIGVDDADASTVHISVHGETFAIEAGGRREIPLP
ncbi:MAG: glycoside hydrolase family 65 protein [Bradymonadaceae bacterium]